MFTVGNTEKQKENKNYVTTQTHNLTYLAFLCIRVFKIKLRLLSKKNLN